MIVLHGAATHLQWTNIYHTLPVIKLTPSLFSTEYDGVILTVKNNDQVVLGKCGFQSKRIQKDFSQR